MCSCFIYVGRHCNASAGTVSVLSLPLCTVSLFLLSFTLWSHHVFSGGVSHGGIVCVEAFLSVCLFLILWYRVFKSSDPTAVLTHISLIIWYLKKKIRTSFHRKCGSSYRIQGIISVSSILMLYFIDLRAYRRHKMTKTHVYCPHLLVDR